MIIFSVISFIFVCLFLWGVVDPYASLWWMDHSDRNRPTALIFYGVMAALFNWLGTL